MPIGTVGAVQKGANPMAVADTTTIALPGRRPQSRFIIRTLEASDADACDRFCRQIEHEDVRRRFGTQHCLSRYFLPSHDGKSERVAFAAREVSQDILGVVTLSYLSAGLAEVALIVRSDRKRRGIGRSLLAYAIEYGEQDGLAQLVGYVLAGNTPMLALAQQMGFRSLRWDEFLIEVRRSVSSPSGRAPSLSTET